MSARGRRWRWIEHVGPRGARHALRCHVVRLHPEQGTHHVRVLVFATKREMYTYLPLERQHAGSCVGMTITDTAHGRTRTRPLVAEVCLYAGALGVEPVTHELFHATMAWGRRIGFDFTQLDQPTSVTNDEERVAYAHGRLCDQFFARIAALGLRP